VLLVLVEAEAGPALCEALLFLGICEGLRQTQVSLLGSRSDLDATLGQIQLSLGHGVNIDSEKEELGVRLQVCIEGYLSILVGCHIEEGQGGVP